MRAVAL